MFTVFPQWANWAVTPKLLVLAGWLLAALVVLRAGAMQSEHVQDLVVTVALLSPAG